MNCLKKHYIHFLFFSFFITVPCAVSMANPGQEEFPPLPPDQDTPFLEAPKLPPKDSDNIIHYRGNRIYIENIELKVAQTKCERLDNDNVCLEIFFNQSINPRSVGHDSLTVNAQSLPEGTRFSFNKKGDTIKIVFAEKSDSFTLKVLNVLSFNGRPMEPVELVVEVQEESEAADLEDAELQALEEAEDLSAGEFDDEL